MSRLMTDEEIKMVRDIFGDSLPYSRIRCHRMVGTTSITPIGNPYFSDNRYCADFSNPPGTEEQRDLAQWVFVHELTHVWQHYHGINVIRHALCISKLPIKYDDAYNYFLIKDKPFLSYNIEQQASIVADYWALFHGNDSYYNRDPGPRPSDYVNVIKAIKQSGPPRVPVRPGFPEFPVSE